MLSISRVEDYAELSPITTAIIHLPRPLPLPQGSKSRLHNFSFPTRSWGSTRIYRCSKLPAGSATPLSSDPKPSAAAASTAEEEASSPPARPWNLRTRLAACNAPMEGTGAGGRARMKNPGSASPVPSPVPSPAPMEKGANGGRTFRLRSDSVDKEGGERRKFSVQLSLEEIEEDFYAFKGTKPPRRPKKRPRIIQRQLDSLFPGLWLPEVKPDIYKIKAKEGLVKKLILWAED